MTTIPNCPTCGNAPDLDMFTRTAQCAPCRNEYDVGREVWLRHVPAASQDLTPDDLQHAERDRLMALCSQPSAMFASSQMAPLMSTDLSQNLTPDEIARADRARVRAAMACDEIEPLVLPALSEPIARVQGYQCPTCPRGITVRKGVSCRTCSPRFVVMSGAEAVGQRAGYFGTAHCADVIAAQWNAGADASGYMWETVTTEWAGHGLSFVVDTEAPRPLPEGCVLDTSKPQAAGGEVPYTGYARLQQHRREVPPPAPPTDEEIVKVMAARLRGEECYGPHSRNGIRFGDLVVTEAECRAAWSRVLAAKVREADEQRRRDGLVRVQPDDADDAGAADA